MRSVGHSITNASTAGRSVIFIQGQVNCNRGVSSCRGVGSMNSSSSSSSWDVFSHPGLSAMPIVVEMSHLIVELDPWILRLLPLPLFVALWCPSTSRVENMHPSFTSISISMMFTLSSSFHSSVWIPPLTFISAPAMTVAVQPEVWQFFFFLLHCGCLHLPFFTSASQAAWSSSSSGCKPTNRPFSGPPYYSKNFFVSFRSKKNEKKALPLIQMKVQYKYLHTNKKKLNRESPTLALSPQNNY